MHGQALWPKSVTRSFWRQRQVDRYLARIFPAGSPNLPRIDYAQDRLVLIATGPRSSTGYGVQVLKATERRGDIHILARELTPSLGDHVETAADLSVPLDHDPGHRKTRLRTVAGTAMTDDPILDGLRQQISAFDRAIVEAVNHRLELVAQIKAYKESRGVDFLDPEREQQMLDDLARSNRGPLSEEGCASCSR